VLLVFALLRRSARRARAKQLKREVELVEAVAPMQAAGVRDGVLSRQAGALRNSLEVILAASEMGAARERNLAAATAAEHVGQSSSGKGDGDGWGTLPPYAR
jgi:hypothetical protein